MNSRGYQIPKVSTIFKQGVSFFSKNNPVFWNSKIPSYSKNRGNVKWREFHSSRSNGLYTRNWVDFKESNHSLTSPRLFYSKIRNYFRTAVVSNTGSFILFQKLHLFFQFQNRGDVIHREFHSSRWNSRFSARWVSWREFHPPPPTYIPDFWNSRIREYSRTAGISSKGSFISLPQTACRLEAESLWRRVTRFKDSRGYSYSRNLEYFRTAGILKWREFH